MRQLQAEATRIKLILTAERLFALHGMDKVKIQDVNDAAEQRNKSAIYYHFGSKEDFVYAIYDYRLAQIDKACGASLDALLARTAAPGMLDIVLATFSPPVDMLLDEDFWYFFRFAAHGTFMADATQVPLSRAAKLPAFARFLEAVIRAAPDIPLEVARLRWRQAILAFVALASEWAREVHVQTPGLGEAALRDRYLDYARGIAAYLSGPYIPAAAQQEKPSSARKARAGRRSATRRQRG